MEVIECFSTPAAVLADGGRTVVTPLQNIASLRVSREITVPSGGAQDFARTVDVFTNPTGMAITTPVKIVGNLGSDAATTVFKTMNADGTFDSVVDPTDRWIGTDDADGTGTPAIIHYIHGPNGIVPATAQVIGDNIEWTYNMTVPANSTVRLALFTILHTTRAGAEAAAAALVTPLAFGGNAAQFLTASELSSLANFSFSDTDVEISNGNLVITDVSGGTSNDMLTIALNGANVRISDPNTRLQAGNGATQIDAYTVEVPLASITGGNIQVNTLGGNDSLTLALAGGDFIPAGGVVYAGGSGIDSLTITGGIQGTVTYNYTNANDGSIVMSNFGSVIYTGLDPITNSGSASDVVFNLPASGNVQAILEDDGISGNALTTFRSGPIAFETTTFANPTGSLTINRGSASDDVSVSALPDFNASLTIGSAALPLDSILFSGGVALMADKILFVNASGTISLPNASSDLATSGMGSINLITARNISLASGASLLTSDGDILLYANQQASATAGAFVGISLDNAALTSNGSGKLELKGRGGDSASGGQIGIRVSNAGMVKSGSGMVVMAGSGGNSSGNDNVGVNVSSPGSLITSTGGNVQVTGTGGGTGSGNHGLSISSGGVIRSGGAGTTSVVGTGGSTVAVSSGGDNYGVSLVFLDSLISSSGGNVSVTGTGGGTGNSSFNYGVYVNQAGAISAGGSGTLTVIGNGGNTGVGGTGNDNVGVNVSSAGSLLSTAGGNLSVSGAAGGGVSFGIVLADSGRIDATTGTPLVTIIADSMNLASLQSVDAGSNTVVLRPRTAGTLINLGGSDVLSGSPLTLGLTDAELDSISAGTIIVGDVNSGAITVSAAMTQGAKNLIVTTGGNNGIAFSGAGALSTTGNVTLATSAAGSGGIQSGAAAIDVTANTLSLTSGSAGIGANGNPFVFEVTDVATSSGGNGSQFLSTTATATIANAGLNAGTGSIRLDGGQFALGGAHRIDDSSQLIVNGASFDVADHDESVDSLTLIGGSITGGLGALTSTNTIQVHSGSITAKLAGASGLLKSTVGTATLSGANTYTGTTNVNGGRLLVNGSLADGPAAVDVVVASGATLGGTGSILGAVQIQPGGELAPGASPGILSVGDTVLSDNSVFEVEIGGTSPGNLATNHDQLNVTGTVTIGTNVTLSALAFNGFVPVDGNTFAIIRNDGTDAVSGTFNGLPEGAILSNFLGSGLDAKLSYVGNVDSGSVGNDVVIYIIAYETEIQVSSGNLIITDILGGTTNDALTIALNGTNVRISDPNNILKAGAGATQIDLNTVDVPFASIMGGNIQVNTLGGNDSLTLALAGGDFIPAGGVVYAGGSGNDLLTITGGNQGTVTYNYTNANDGSIVMSNFGTVTYTGLEPITNSGTAADVIFNLPATTSEVTLGDDGINGNALSRLSSSLSTFELTNFSNPTGSLTINRGSATDTITVNAMPDFTAALTIGSIGNAFSSATVAGTVSLSNKPLAISANSISVAAPVATGGGNADLLASNGILLSRSLTTGGGNATLNADSDGDGIGTLSLAFAISQFIDPNPAPGNQFGHTVLPLISGNVVVTSPYDDAGGPDAGAVYLFNGQTGALLSTLRGSTAGDQVGYNGVTALSNGNYVARSTNWDNGTATDAGAATWGSGISGVSGVVSAANSLVGSMTGDRVSLRDVIALSNGNYVVVSNLWNNGAAIFVGAVTWGSGAAGISGVVSASNSLVGSKANDQVGGNGATALSNGNYVVDSPYWDNGAATDAGAMTWGSGTTGVSGVVSAANSLVGSMAGDFVGSYSVTALSNGNYVVRSPNWDNGAATNAGAVTWGSGISGVSGVISSLNSLVGSTAGDQVGQFDIIALSNGNYVVGSYTWDNGAAYNAGAVTWGSGTTGVSGAVSAANSLVGTTAGDYVGSALTALSNGNYVVRSPSWDNGAAIDAGAVTWGSGTTGVSGVVSSANSLVGSNANDEVGSVVTALSNGNYVISSPYWDYAAATDVGAVTWGSGTAGVSGLVSVANSLVGSTPGDFVGSVTALSNGNYVVQSASWANGAATNAGAVTWGSGTTGVSGVVSSANSLVGSTAGDQLGQYYTVIVLSNGNYLVHSPNWDNGAASDAGAVTWGSGTTGVSGVISDANSLVGSTAYDLIGTGGIFLLSNSNYVVLSNNWDNGPASDAGAVSWGSGNAGVSGVVSISNSVIGNTAYGGSSIGITITANGDGLFARLRQDNSGRVVVGSQALGFGSLAGSLNTVNGMLSSGGNVSITAADVDLQGTIDTAAGSVSFIPSTAGRTFDLGATGGAGQFVLTDEELDRVTTTNTIVVGAANAGNVVFTGAIDLANATTLEISTAGTVNDTGTNTVYSDNNLAISTALGIGTTTPLNISVSNLEAFGGTGGVNVANTGDLTLGGVTTLLEGVSTTNAPITISAASAIAVTETISSGGGNIELSATNGITLSSSLTTGGGNASLQADSDTDGNGTLTISAGGSIAAANGDVSLTAAKMLLDGNVTSGSTVTLLPSSGLSINLGSTTDLAANTLELSGAELDRITASGIIIGDTSTSATTVSAAISHLADSNFQVITGRNIAFNPGSSWATTAGNLNLIANQQVSATSGDFIGIDVSNGIITSIGTGRLDIRGRGGDSASGNQIGVRVSSGGQIIGGSGSVEIFGYGGISSANGNNGVDVSSPGSLVSSTGGNVSVTGTGGGTDSSNNHGVSISSGGEISSGGSGTMTVIGNGGAATTAGIGSDNYGVYVVFLDSKITSAGGNVSVTGTGGGAGGSSYNYGVYIDQVGEIGAGGNGTITVVGNGGNAAAGSIGTGNVGVNVASLGSLISSMGGNVSVTGTGGGADSSNNHGLSISSGGVISSGGTGTVNVIGNGGATVTAGIGTDNYGVYVVFLDSSITSAGGNVSVTGTGGGVGSSSFNYGVYIDRAGAIGASGTGTVAVVGNGGNAGVGASGTGNTGIVIAATDSVITSAGGNVSLTGTGGSGPSLGIVLTDSGRVVVIAGSPIVTIVADSMDLGSTTSVDANSNTVLLRPKTAGTSIDLGGADILTGSPLTLGLTDAELGSITAGTIVVGDVNSGAVTVSEAITQGAKNLIVTTGGNFGIAFSGAGALSTTGNVTLETSAVGSGSILSGGATIDITANSLRLTSGSAGIGADGNPFVFAVNNVTTSSGGNGNQFLSSIGTATIANAGLSAGTGSVRLDGGQFSLGGAHRIDDSSQLIVNGASFDIAGHDESVDSLTLIDGSITGGLGTLTSNTTFQIHSGSVSAKLAGANGLTKSTLGTATLSADNSYTGTTHVHAGTLLIHGSITSDALVGSGATLGGTGTLHGNVSGNGIIAPGASPGILTIAGDFTPTGVVQFEVNQPYLIAGVDYDQIIVGGLVDLSGATLVFSGGTLAPTTSQPVTLIRNDSTVATIASNSPADGATVTLGSAVLKLFYNAGDGNNVVFETDTTPPEVSAPDLHEDSDTGFSNSDNITKLTSLRFDGTAEADSIVRLYNGALLLGSTTATGGTWSLSGIVLLEGAYALHTTATDAAGNTSVSDSINVVVDTTAPVLSSNINGPSLITGWYNIATGPATVAYLATDVGGSGVTTPANHVFADGADQSIADTTVVDVAGNVSNLAGAFSDIKQDTVAPVLSATINALAGTGWYNIATGPATVTYLASDVGGSGVISPANHVFADGADQSIADTTVVDVAGNVSNLAGAFSDIKQDTVAPVLSATINAPAGTGWYNIATGPATVTYLASDVGGSGVTTPANHVFADGADQSIADTTVVDVAGNVSNLAGAFSDIKQDTVAPVLSATINAPAGTGWYNIATGPATVTYLATDVGGSGVTTPANHVFADGADQSIANTTVIDVAGNVSNLAGAFNDIKQDTVAPVLSATINAPAGTGWYNIATGPATVTYLASDVDGSGVTTPANHVFADGADQSIAAVTVTDVAGNVSNSAGTFYGINQDTVAPVLSATINAPAGTGWYNIATGAATITYLATDVGGSGVTTPANHVFADGADQSIADTTVVDVAGNVSNLAGAFSDIKQDTVAPVLSATINAPAGTGWYNIATGPATVTYLASDVGSSGVTTPANHVFADGADQSIADTTVVDVAGNVSNAAGAFNDIKQDTGAPVLSATINAPAGTGWYNIATGPATVYYLAADVGGSGVTTPANHVFADGADQSIADTTVVDVAGNVSNAAGAFNDIKQDTVAPVLSATINAPAGTGWYNFATGPATVTYLATDVDGSGVTTPANHVFTDGADQSIATITVLDVAGNVSNSAGAFNGINQDTVAPVLSATINAPAGTGWYNISTGAATVTYLATDVGGSGVMAPPNHVFADGADQSIADTTVVDVAGNVSNTAGGFGDINQDTGAPVLGMLAANSVNENGIVHLTGAYTDDGLSSHSLTIHWGEGAPQTVMVSGGAFNITHQYLDDNPTNSASDLYTISVTLTDLSSGSSTGSTTTTISNVPPVFVGAISGAVTAVPGQTVSYSAAFSDVGKWDSHTVLINWGDGQITSGTVTETIGTGVGTVSGSHSYSGHGTYAITFTLKDDDLGSVSKSLSLAAHQSIFVLHGTAAGALSVSGNGTLNVAGVVVVDSSSSTALTAKGNAKLTAASFSVVGGIKTTGNAQVNGPVTHVFVPDPLAGIATPALGTVQAAVSVTGNSSRILNPGTYSSISVSGNGSLTLNPGVYILAGGGFSVSGNGVVFGNGVTIVNRASASGSTGSISLTGNGSFSLTPTTSGPLAGIVIFQPEDNTKSLTISGNAASGINGTIYAPKSQANVTGNGSFTQTLIVDRLTFSGNGSNLNAAAVASPVAPNEKSVSQISAGVLWVGVEYGENTATTLEQDARLREAVASLNAALGSYGVVLAVAPAGVDNADIRIHVGEFSPAGGADQGVLGFTNERDVFIVSGWNWFTGSKAEDIGTDQYDYLSVLTHELGHAIGLEHSSDDGSVMNPSLSSGAVRRGLTTMDHDHLAIFDEGAAQDERGDSRLDFLDAVWAYPIDADSGVSPWSGGDIRVSTKGVAEELRAHELLFARLDIPIAKSTSRPEARTSVMKAKSMFDAKQSSDDGVWSPEELIERIASYRLLSR